jgi:hypothetical protein
MLFLPSLTWLITDMKMAVFNPDPITASANATSGAL